MASATSASEIPVSATSVPSMSAGASTMACKVTTSPKPCLDCSTRPIVPWGDETGPRGTP